MSRRTAGLLLLPVTLLFLMTTKVHSDQHSTKSAKPPNKTGATRGQESSTPGKLSAEQEKWVTATLSTMTVEEKVGQLLFATYHGSFTSTDSAAYAQMLHSVNDLHVGGFIHISHGSPLGIVQSHAYPPAELT